jgi:hypothetical protein
MKTNIAKSTRWIGLAGCVASLFATGLAAATLTAPDPNYKIHDSTRPQPTVVEPAVPSTDEKVGKAPSDAVVLFDGSQLDAWCDMEGNPSKWIIQDGVMECTPGSGYIRTLQSFGDCQLHVEFATPEKVQGSSQGRGNSGVFLMGEYEVQVLDSYNNKTYADGHAGAVYCQYPPGVNASRPPGKWQTYDIIFLRPHFDAQGKLISPARMTVIHNGVLIQNNVELTGPTGWLRRAPYRAHADKLPLSLQDHGNPVRYRNLWIRELPGSGPKELLLASKLLDRYVGKYGNRPNNTIYILRDGDQLLAGVQNPSKELAFPLFADSKTRFFVKSVDIVIEFNVNADGVPESLNFILSGDKNTHKKYE